MKASLSVDEATKLPPKTSGWLRGGIRLLIGVALISFLISQSDFTSIKETLADAKPPLILAGYLLHVVLLILSAFRWRVFLEALEIELPVTTTIRLMLVGAFFNTFLPTGVGGDAYKAVRLRNAKASLAISVSSVLLDRVAGIATLALVTIPVAIVAILLSDSGTLGLVALALSACVLLLTVLLLVRGANLLGGGKGTWFGIRPRLRRALEASTIAVRRPSAIRRSLVLGLMCQGCAVAVYMTLARSLGLAIPLSVIVFGLLSATLAAGIPVTVNGLGVREAVWVWGLGLYGVGRVQALTFAILVLAVVLGTNALGGIVYVLAGGEVSARNAKAG